MEDLDKLMMEGAYCSSNLKEDYQQQNEFQKFMY